VFSLVVAHGGSEVSGFAQGLSLSMATLGALSKARPVRMTTRIGPTVMA